MNIFEAVKYDIRLHGGRFMLVGLGAFGLAIVELPQL